MSAREELSRDHHILRAKLALLEEWLPHTHAIPFTLLNLIRTIARRLQQHTEREHAAIERLSSARHGQASPPISHLLHDHRDQDETLMILEELLAKGRACEADRVVTYASHLIDSLREHMANEEERFFPFLEQAEDLSTDLPVPCPARQTGQSVHAAALTLPWRAEAVRGGSWAPQNP
jgi:iron-sulfur cluster repair protein YtfE (RIC family)